MDYSNRINAFFSMFLFYPQRKQKENKKELKPFSLLTTRASQIYSYI